jgi:hypothetical protein
MDTVISSEHDSENNVLVLHCGFRGVIEHNYSGFPAFL